MRSTTMTKEEYIKTAVDSAKRYIARGRDAHNRVIKSPAAYLDGTATRAAMRYDGWSK